MFQGQSVAGLDLDRRDAFGPQPIEPGSGTGKQGLVAGQPRGGHRGSDPAACLRDLLVRGALEPQLEFGCALACIDQVRVRIDQSRCNQRTAEVMLNFDIQA